MGAAVPRAVMVASVKGGNTDECLAKRLAPRRSLSSFLPSGPQGLHEKGSLQHLPLLVIYPHTGGWEARESPSVHAAGGNSSGEHGQGGVWAQTQWLQEPNTVGLALFQPILPDVIWLRLDVPKQLCKHNNP